MNSNEAQYFFSKFSGLIGNPNHRYLSWEHCYKVFMKERQKTNSNIDLLCLYLGFYLASWGMMRGSSELLQKDYKIHSDAIKILLDNKYNTLWGKTWQNSTIDANDIRLIFDKNGLVDELKTYYGGVSVSPTETLISKIIMGTLGCIPAYDRFLKKGFGAEGMIQNFGKNSLCRLINTYGASSFTLPSLRSKHYTISYPQMKIIDCVFWQYGFYMDEIENMLKGTTTLIQVTNTQNPSNPGVLTKTDNSYSINGGKPMSLADIVKAGWHL